MNNSTALNRTRVEGLLIRSIYIYDYDIRRLSDEQLLQRAWEIVRKCYNLRHYSLCRTAFELLLDMVEENRLITLGLPGTKQEVLFYLETKKQQTNIELDLEQFEDLLRVVNDEFNQINNLVYPNQPSSFQILRAEIKRLKVQDLINQIPLKKQELEQLINTVAEQLNRAERYILEKLLQENSRILQTNDNFNVERLNELKEVLSETLIQEELQTLLNKQSEIFYLAKHLENLQTE
ncbi:12079_t:CDS:1 [Cetraspora pellucida]|uniref:12079_t:CDS:1 n=1 Tax=Cetraspora pellucida TaxID=1433469 RepID=A0A9N9G256_9GLOM|nr:12079_t:CDS:1 [Cetraspora pellucida]